MHYQILIIIHKCSKKLLKMKNSKHFFLAPPTMHERAVQHCCSRTGERKASGALMCLIPLIVPIA